MKTGNLLTSHPRNNLCSHKLVLIHKCALIPTSRRSQATAEILSTCVNYGWKVGVGRDTKVREGYFAVTRAKVWLYAQPLQM